MSRTPTPQDDEPIEIPESPDEDDTCPECDGDGCEDCEYAGVVEAPKIKELDEF